MQKWTELKNRQTHKHSRTFITSQQLIELDKNSTKVENMNAVNHFDLTEGLPAAEYNIFFQVHVAHSPT